MTQTAIDEPMLDEEWLAAPRKRSRSRIVLSGLLLASLCFLGGALAQKHLGTATEEAAGPGSLTSGEIPEGLPEGFPGGAGGLTGGSAPGETTGAEDDSESVIGTVVRIRGDVWLVEDLGGERHEVKVGDDTDLVQETEITTAHVQVGDRIDVSGATTDGQLQADDVTLR